MVRLVLLLLATLSLVGAAPPPALNAADRAEVIANSVILLEQRYVGAKQGALLAARAAKPPAAARTRSNIAACTHISHSIYPKAARFIRLPAATGRGRA